MFTTYVVYYTTNAVYYTTNVKSGKNIMYTFTIMVHVANLYIIFLPDFSIVCHICSVQFYKFFGF